MSSGISIPNDEFADVISNPRVDQWRKLTVSLGGRCPLQCRHCYVTAPQFGIDRKRTVEETMEIVRVHLPEVSIVCVSGDVDCFIQERNGIDLIEQLVDELDAVDVMYTTRIVPSDYGIKRLQAAGRKMARRRRLLIPGVSFVTTHFPNAVEHSRLTGSVDDRLTLLGRLLEAKQPTFAALRPTFPFSVVPHAEVAALIERCAPVSTCVLGEVLLLDPDGAMAAQLELPPFEPQDVVEPMTFLRQPHAWRKRPTCDEAAFARERAAAVGMPYFLRSVSAVKFLRSYWDFETGTLTYRLGDPVDRSTEGILP